MAQKAGAKGVAAAERRRIAIELRKAGATYEEIGRSLGISKQSAYESVTRALAEIKAKTTDAADAVKTIELERLDAMFKGLWPSASKGNPQAVEKALRVMERRAKLLGIDAPTKVANTDPTGEHERQAYAFPVPPNMTTEAWAEWAHSLKR